MSYQVRDTTDGLNQAMKLVKPAMKGMPNKSSYLGAYDDMRRKVAMLIMSITDGEEFFDPDGKTRRNQKVANDTAF